MRTNLDFYPKSLLKEAKITLGEEFSRLPNRIQTGYIQIIWDHSEVIKYNQHNRDPSSFALGNEELSNCFTDFRNFKAVNTNGYYLRPKSNRYGLLEGQYVLSRKQVEGSIEHKPTNWLIKTQEGFQGWKEVGVVGSKNGYKMSNNINHLLDNWYNKSLDNTKEESGFVNNKNETLEEIETKIGGGINRDKSNINKEVNINLNTTINKNALKVHREILKILKGDIKIREARRETEDNKPTFRITTTVDGVLGQEETVYIGGTLGRVNRDLSLQSLSSKELSLEGIDQRLSEINKLLIAAREGGGSTVPVIYTEVDTGRYTAKGAILQGYHKSVRYAALAGCYEYDLEAAHQNILIQLLDKMNKNFPELQVLRDYVTNKQHVREKLAKEVNTSITVVKEIIQELTYGARLSKSPRQAVHKSCGGDDLLLEKVTSNQWLKSLESVFKLAHKHLIEDRNNIVNAVGIPFNKEKKGKSSEMAHVLQGYERLILDAILKHSNRNDVALLIHDCVIFYKQQSTKKLSMIVEEETGFKLEFSEVEY